MNNLFAEKFHRPNRTKSDPTKIRPPPKKSVHEIAENYEELDRGGGAKTKKYLHANGHAASLDLVECKKAEKKG